MILCVTLGPPAWNHDSSHGARSPSGSGNPFEIPVCVWGHARVGVISHTADPQGFSCFVASDFHLGPWHRSLAWVSFAELWTVDLQSFGQELNASPGIISFHALRNYPGPRNFLQITAGRSPGVPVSSSSGEVCLSLTVPPHSRSAGAIAWCPLPLPPAASG